MTGPDMPAKELELFSTMLYRHGAVYLLAEHIARLRRSLARLRLDYAVPTENQVLEAVRASPAFLAAAAAAAAADSGAAAATTHAHADAADADGNARHAAQGGPTLRCRMLIDPSGIRYEVHAFSPAFEDTTLSNERLMLGPFLPTPQRPMPSAEIVSGRRHWTIVLDTTAVDAADASEDGGSVALPLLQNKTTSRAAYEAAARRTHADAARRQEALLHNTEGIVTEGTITSVALWREQKWMVPPIGVACLDGVVRKHLLDRGFVVEAPPEQLKHLHVDTVKVGDWCLIFNALRGVNWALVVAEHSP